MLLMEAIGRCCNGPTAKAVPGMRGHVLMLLKEAIWKSCNGSEARAVPGMRTHVSMLLVQAIWRSYNGSKAKAAHVLGEFHINNKLKWAPNDSGFLSFVFVVVCCVRVMIVAEYNFVLKVKDDVKRHRRSIATTMRSC